MYTISDYGIIMADRVRMEAHAEALRRAVRPGCTVADIGAGTGILAFLACQLGARRVYAIEPQDAIHLAETLAAENGFSDRIECIQDFSTRVTLPEKVDVIISDLRDILPPYRQNISTVADARRRFLAPGGVLIPQRDVLWAAVAEAPQFYCHHVGPWESNPYGLATHSGRALVVNSWERTRLGPESLLAEPQAWATLDYSTLEDPDVRGNAKWRIARAGTAHGILIWFDATLVEGVGFSNAPGSPSVCYANAFFFLEKPTPLAEGDVVSVEIQANLVGEEYVWQWSTTLQSGADAGRVIGRFEQATFYESFPSPQRMRKLAANHQPELSSEGRVDQYALSLMDGRNSLEQIARRLAEQFPSRFTTWKEALTRAGILSQRYSR
jgi:protein arginine N-methyltransferase 1